MTTLQSVAVDSPPGSVGYGRARLWLGITGVGTMVIFSTAGLALGWPASAADLFPATLAGDATLFAAFVAIYIAMQLPMDIFGGYLAPKRHGRTYPPFARFVIDLGRGIAVHGLVLYGVALLLLLAGRRGGTVGLLAVGFALPLMLLLLRFPLARVMARFGSPVSCQRLVAKPAPPVPTGYLASDDEGFTGGVLGVLRARGIVVPQRWGDILDQAGLDAAVRRRAIVINSGAWLRGRLAALGFTWAGFVLCVWLVGVDVVATARGVIELSLAFTLWSFLGLLVLPTFSRRAVNELDRALLASGVPDDVVEDVARRLDQLQDDEPQRPALVETIFHPVPSLNNRVASQGRTGLRCCWDVARTAIYISPTGLSLLGRSVHCNCGRPALWVLLPCD